MPAFLTVVVSQQPLDFCTIRLPTDVFGGGTPTAAHDVNAKLERIVRQLGSMGATDAIWTSRGKAIHGYAQLESALCAVLASLSGMSHSVAAEVFYKITNSSARNGILEKLLHKKYGTIYNAFWNEYLRQLRTLDLKRNEIVHWLGAVYISPKDDGALYVGVGLIPPARANDVQDAPFLTAADLEIFETKCEEFAHMAFSFSQIENPKYGSLRDTFQQPFVYPLPKDHPLFRQPLEPDNQPQS